MPKKSVDRSPGWYQRRDRCHVWHPYTRDSSLRDGFPVIVKGEGNELIDIEGRRYVDAIASWWAVNLGHGEPRLVKAITDQAGRLQHSILGNLSHDGAVALAGELVAWFPDPSRHVFFSSDGASAVEAALKIAVSYWAHRGRSERCRLATLQDDYHGDTLGAVSVGYLPGFHEALKPLLFDVYRADSPDCAHCPAGRRRGRCRCECFASMQTIFDRHAARLAAVIVEPLCQGAAGMRVYPAEYLRRLDACCRKHHVLLIVDEIAMGFGRTGRMFAFEHAGLDPDIVCLGKGLSGGMLPISATVVKDRIYRQFKDTPEDHTFYHGHTFGGNPIAAAAALQTLAIYRELDIVGYAGRMGRMLARKLAPLRRTPGVRDVRCLGMLAAVELDDWKGQSGGQRAQTIRRRLLEQGILLRPLGPVVYLMPPLTMARGDLVRLADALIEAVKVSLAG